MTEPAESDQPFSLLMAVHRDPVMASIFSERSTVDSWLRVEAELARAQAACGVIGEPEAVQIAAAADRLRVDPAALWRATGTVGYPILPLVNALCAALSEEAAGKVHYGATTQDVMDTGLALQIAAACDRLDELAVVWGDGLVDLTLAHRGLTMAARTHGQQAVPTTLGAKFAVYLAEVTRQRARIGRARSAAGFVSLFGAGGTSAALGPRADQVRVRLAAALGLRVTTVPWHVARDGLAEYGLVCASFAASCVRFAREIVDLSRTEIRELGEAVGYQRGASSTMPQKANPIISEAVIGLGATAGALASALFRAMEAGHERAAGEWQIEWHVLPELSLLASSALRLTGHVARELVVNDEAMAANLTADGGLLMSEAIMMRLAPALGRDVAHDLVYRAAQSSRTSSRPLAEVLTEQLSAAHPGVTWDGNGLNPGDYVGEAEQICDAAVREWKESR